MNVPAVGDLALLLPETALAIGLCVVLARDLAPGRGPARLATWLGIATCLVATLLALPSSAGAVGPLAIDSMTGMARVATGALTALLLVASLGERRSAKDRDDGAFTALVLSLALGCLLTASSTHLLTLWLGLELIALPSYVLVAWRPGDSRAAEAGMKFVLFSGACSAVMAFGISHVYGITGSLDIATALSVIARDSGSLGNSGSLGLGALCLVAVGLAAKLTLAPFHFYAPDVYQGAPSLCVAAVSGAPKIAAACALLRAVHMMGSDAFALGMTTLLAVVAASSVVFAALTALVQRDAKRILAFSGIGHGAVVVLAIGCTPGSSLGSALGSSLGSSLGGDAAGAAAFYLLAYVPANLGAFVCLSVLENARGSASLLDLAGAGKRQPVVTGLLCLFLASLAGVPPLAGFLGKWNVLQVAFARGLAPDSVPALAATALLLVVATAVAAWSYLLIVRAVAFADAPVDGERPAVRPALATVVVLALCALGTLVGGLWLSGAGVLARAM